MTAYIRLTVFVFIGYVFSVSSMANGFGISHEPGTNDSSPPIHLHNLAMQGSATAQYELGLLYEYGRGVDQDDFIALYWYEKSAAQSFTNALYRLAILYDNGWGLLPDKEKALSLYQKAANNGHPFAQHDLAIMYFKGTDAPKNLPQAYKWLKIAVYSGNPLMQKHLKMVEKAMSTTEIDMAESLVQEWIEQSGM